MPQYLEQKYAREKKNDEESGRLKKRHEIENPDGTTRTVSHGRFYVIQKERRAFWEECIKQREAAFLGEVPK